MAKEHNLKTHNIAVEEIYVPAPRRKTLEAAKVDELSEDILENGLQRPIQVRTGKDRYVIVEGYHRLQACIALGEEAVDCYIVQAKKF